MNFTKKHLFFILAFASSFIAAIVAGLNAVLNAAFILDPFILGFAIFFVGLPVTLVLVILFSLPYKGKKLGNKLLDPSFHGIRLLTKPELKYHLLAGIGNSVFTMSYVFLFSLVGDPSVVLPFIQVVIVYLIIVESFAEKNVPTLIEIQSAIIVTIGAVLGSLSLHGSINIESLIVVFALTNPGWVLFTIYQRKLKRLKIKDHPNDSLNIRFWNVIFSLGLISISILIYDVVTGATLFITSLSRSIQFFWPVSTVAIATFFSYALYIRALGIGKASVTQAIRASTIIFGIPISLFIAAFGFIQPFSLDPFLLLIKASGIILIILGILSFALTQIKAYLFITVKPGHSLEEMIQQLWNVKGVIRVAVVAGEYDFIVKVRTRTLVKGYEHILKRIQNIEGIKEFSWYSVLKDWEKI